MIALLALVLLAQASPTPTPFPSPTPASTPPPAVNVGVDFTAYAFHTNGANATGALDVPSGVDLPDRGDLSNLLFNVSAGTGELLAKTTPNADFRLRSGQRKSVLATPQRRKIATHI